MSSIEITTRIEASDLNEFLLFGDLLGEVEPLIQRSNNDEGERNILIQSFYKKLILVRTGVGK